MRLKRLLFALLVVTNGPHISQVRTNGWIKFYWNYLMQLIKVGYMKNTWEIEAYAEQNEQAWPANVPDHPAI